MKDTYKPVIYILLIVFSGIISYSNTLNVPFHFDDDVHIAHGHVVKDLSFFLAPSRAEQIKHPAYYTLLSEYMALKSRYIGYLTLALNYRIHGLDVAGYHVFNISVHILNAFLLYWLVTLIFKTPYFSSSFPVYGLRSGIRPAQRPDSPSASTVNRWPPAHSIALFSALIFVSHPVQTQAVTYIIQRFTSLATTFYFLSIVMYVKARFEVKDKAEFLSAPALTFYFLSLFSAVLAMKTKEIAFTLPVVISLCEFMFFQGKVGKRILYLLPLILTMAVIPLTYLGLHVKPGDLMGEVGSATRIQSDLSRADYLFTQFRVLVTYVRLLFFPVNQTVDYDYPVYHSFLNPGVFLSFIFLLSILGIAVYFLFASRLPAGQASRLISFGILWFFIAVSVESGIMPIRDVIFEHRLYLPSAGALMAAVAALFAIAGWLKQRWRPAGKAVIPVFIAAVLMLAGAAYSRNSVWRDGVSLWEDVVRKDPGNLRGYYNLGVAYSMKNRFKKALAVYKRAVTINPDFMIFYNAFNSRGVAYLNTAQYNRAVEDFNIAASVTPDDDYVYYNRGTAYLSLGDAAGAISDFRTACSLGNGKACETFNRLSGER